MKINNNLILNNRFSLLIIGIGALLCLYATYFINPKIGLIVGALPLISIIIAFTFNNIQKSLLILFIFNYFIMGINRYISSPIPITNIFDLIFSLILFSIIIKQIYNKDDFSNTINPYTFIMMGWAIVCIIYLFNDTTGCFHFGPWLKGVRPLGFYPIITCLILSVGCNNYKYIKKFLIIWGVVSIMGSLKAIMQYKHGFDSAEMTWLMTVGARTHIINTGIRYFSFFTDAANFGCSMGFSSIVFLISSFYEKVKRVKIFYWIVCIFSFYGFLLSGTRAAIAVPFAGLALFVIISKNWKLCIGGITLLLVSLFILKFTTLGNSSQFIRRMRTAFDTEDASFQVRLDNQKTLKKYMSDAPFGIGIGITNGDISNKNKFYFVSTCPPDSDLVNIWIHLGRLGLIIYLFFQFIIYSSGCFVILFKIKNPEIRGPLAAMLCGCAGVLVASYANMISFQFPNGIIMYSCLTFVFLGPFFDKQYSLNHDKQ